MGQVTACVGVVCAPGMWLQIGWAKLQELRRYIKLFRDSGKFTIAYMKVAGVRRSTTWALR